MTTNDFNGTRHDSRNNRTHMPKRHYDQAAKRLNKVRAANWADWDTAEPDVWRSTTVCRTIFTVLATIYVVLKTSNVW